jgi:uncharacterized membrane protein YphA (DoxX/SURF4 family)
VTSSNVIAAVAAGALAGVFVVSSVAKLRDRVATASAMRGLRLPAHAGDSVAAVELFTALGLLMERRTPWAAMVATTLLVVFTTFVIVNIALGRRVPCPCFGATIAPLGLGTVARNLGLVALAVVATTERRSAWWIAWLVAFPTAGLVLWARRAPGSTSGRR